MKHINQTGTAVLLAGLLFTSGIQAAELSALQWKSSLGEDAVMAVVDERVKVKTSELDGGKRLRVSFPATSMVADLKPLSGKGLVESVEAVKDGKSVQIDLVTSIPAHISVISVPGGYRISTEPAVSTAPIAESGPTVIPLAMTSDISGAAAVTVEPAKPEPAKAMPSGGAAAVNSIKQITYSRIGGGRVQVNIQMDARPDEPAIFVTKNPSRIAMDFFNTRNGLGKNTLDASEGVLHSINAVEVADRTRVILNLDQNASYQTEITDSGITLTLDPDAVKAAPGTAARHMKFSGSTVDKVHRIDGIDFRRGPQGEGNITVNLSDPEVGIDIDDEKGQVIIDFSKTTLHEDLERRLDVIDFATPIQTIDTFREGKGTRMVITVDGQYEQIAYQTGNTFTVSVRKLTKNELKEEDEFGYSGERLSLNFQKIDVRSSLQVIADFTGLNIVTSDTVKGSLTLRLQDVPWDQALDLILKTKGLAKREKGNVVWIAPAKEIAAREKAELEALKKTRELEPLISELIEINYATAKDIAKLLKSIKAIDTFQNATSGNPFSSVSVNEIPTESNSLLSERGSVTVDERTNSLLIQETPSKIKEIKKLIRQLDLPVKQVLIETRIVEARDGYSRVLGVRLGMSNLNRNFNLGSSDNSAGEAVTSGTLEGAVNMHNAFNDPSPDGDIEVTGDGLNVDLGAGGLGGFAASTIAFTLAKFADGYGQVLGVELQALQAEGKGKLISSPRLITANNMEAHIEQGQERIFTTNVLGVGSVVTKKAVLGLTVTPHITPDNRIIMDVFITKDSFVSPNSPTIDKKEIETQILLDHGETAVIGGIFQQTLGEDVTKVPLLGDLPLVGVLFRNKSLIDNKTELLIFLTPKIITPSFGLLGGS